MEEGVQDGVCTYLKGKGILIPAAPWVNFEDTVLSEMSRHGRTNTIQIHFSEVPRGVRYIETGGRVVVTRGLGSEWLMGTEYSLLHDGEFRRLWKYLTLPSCALKKWLRR